MRHRLSSPSDACFSTRPTGCITYLVALVVIFVVGFTTEPLTFTWEMMQPTTWHDDMAFFGIVSFSLAVPVLALPIYESMADPSKFVATNTATLFVVGIVFCVFGVLTNGFFSASGIEPIIINNLPQEWAATYAVKIAVSLTLLVSSPIGMVPALAMLENWLFGNPTEDLSGELSPLVERRDSYGSVDELDESHSPFSVSSGTRKSRPIASVQVFGPRAILRTAVLVLVLFIAV